MRDNKDIRSEHSPRSNQHGFTIVELLVSLVVMGFVVLLIGGSLSVFSSSWSRQLLALERQDTLLRGAQVFRKDIRSMRQVVSNNADRKALVFGGDSRTVKFLSYSPAHLNQTGLQVVEYRLLSTPDGYELIRRSGRWRPLTEVSDIELRHPVTLVRGLSEGRFLYGDDGGKKTVWLRRWDKSGALPTLISFSGRVGTNGARHVMVAQVKADTEQVCVFDKEAPCAIATEKASKPRQSGGFR